ncbi:uncharacterized protein LOC101715913 isoform X2 [Heterocephalus glaber]|uniref:Uncharacterized protein LOC101715913 isoform X2 n=1 Tax=Heterocephalus glaber TaxID=10181 RepID=A0AAX6TA20_HETGA|nr:uncharacterized protein LOC101715913 isoform X2 [Heterocephalus glaber]
MTLEGGLLLLLALGLGLAGAQKALDEVPVQPGFDPQKVEGRWFTVQLASSHAHLVSPEDPLKLSLHSIRTRDGGDVEFMLFWKGEGACEGINVTVHPTGLQGQYLGSFEGGRMHVRFASTDYTNLILYVRFEDDVVTSLWVLLASHVSPEPAWGPRVAAEVPGASGALPPAPSSRLQHGRPVPPAQAGVRRLPASACALHPARPSALLPFTQPGCPSAGSPVRLVLALPLWATRSSAKSLEGTHSAPQAALSRKSPPGPWRGSPETSCTGPMGPPTAFSSQGRLRDLGETSGQGGASRATLAPEPAPQRSPTQACLARPSWQAWENGSDTQSLLPRGLDRPGRMPDPESAPWSLWGSRRPAKAFQAR